MRVGESRSKFAERFRTRVGEPPLAYLTRWRMHSAARLLTDDSLTVGEAARQVGYESETAFSKAFRRLFGSAPGAHRRPRGSARYLGRLVASKAARAVGGAAVSTP